MLILPWAQFAEAGEALYCIATVHKLSERQKRTERILAVGEHRLLVLKPKRKGLLASATGAERSRQRMLASCACLFRSSMSPISTIHSEMISHLCIVQEPYFGTSFFRALVLLKIAHSCDFASFHSRDARLHCHLSSWPAWQRCLANGQLR